MPGKRKVNIYSENGNKVKLVQRRSGKTVKTTVSPSGKYKEREVKSSDGTLIRKTTKDLSPMDKKDKSVEVYKDGVIKKTKSTYKQKNAGGGAWKDKQKFKDGVAKKTVHRTPGGVEKEIERGNKRIEVQKYKDEGVKSRTVINMKKNDQYKENNAKAITKAAITGALSGLSGSADFASSLKSSPFKGIPKAMYDNANSSKNTQIDGKISESKPLTTPYKYKKNGSIPSVQKDKSMYINNLKRNIDNTMDILHNANRVDYKGD